LNSIREKSCSIFVCHAVNSILPPRKSRQRWYVSLSHRSVIGLIGPANRSNLKSVSSNDDASNDLMRPPVNSLRDSVFIIQLQFRNFTSKDVWDESSRSFPVIHISRHRRR